MCGSWSGGTPGPSSLTSMVTRPLAADAVIVPAVSAGVCTSTFMSRLSTARRSSSSSPTVARPSVIRIRQVRAGSAILKDVAVKNATQAWSACMARNGYSFQQPQAVFRQEIQNMYGGAHFINADATVSAAANLAQIATAATDANCTQATDLAGIYFAVQASYEQQIVNANTQALNAAVRQYRTGYAKELSKLPALLKTTATASPFPSARPTRTGLLFGL